MQYVERLGYEFAAMLVTLVCISYFASQKFALTLPGTYYLSHKEIKADNVLFCQFNFDHFETAMNEWSIF